MSKRVACAVWAVIAITGFVGTAAGQQQEEEKPARKIQIRNFDHFEFDTVTGTYLGIAAFYTQDHKAVYQGQAKTDSDIGTAELRVFMGGERFQGGLAIPYHITEDNAVYSGENDVGNPRASLKFIPLRRDLFDLGGGLMLSFPGGSEDEGISVPDIGVLPFVTGTAHLGPVDWNAHIGYNFINHSNSNGSPESILYGSTVTFPVLDTFGLRLELAGQEFTSGDNRNVVAIQPGLDYVFFFGDNYGLQLSAAGSYGLSGGAAGSEARYTSIWGLGTISGLSRGEWGVGASVGFLWF